MFAMYSVEMVLTSPCLTQILLWCQYINHGWRTKCLMGLFTVLKNLYGGLAEQVKY